MIDNLYLLGILSASLLQNPTVSQKVYVSKQIPMEYCKNTLVSPSGNTETNSAKINVHEQNLKKIKGFSQLKVTEYLPEIPSEFSIVMAEKVYRVFQDLSFTPQKVAASVEGGVLFEFFYNGTYYAIEAHNSGILTQVKREKGQKGLISKLSETELINQLRNELNSEYGDSQTGEGYPTM